MKRVYYTGVDSEGVIPVRFYNISDDVTVEESYKNSVTHEDEVSYEIVDDGVYKVRIEYKSGGVYYESLDESKIKEIYDSLQIGVT